MILDKGEHRFAIGNLYVEAAVHIGGRQNQEDRIYIGQEGDILTFAVIDGMGGHSRGGEFAQAIGEALSGEFSITAMDRVAKDPEWAESGAAIVCGAVNAKSGRCNIINLGDVRVGASRGEWKAVDPYPEKNLTKAYRLKEPTWISADHSGQGASIFKFIGMGRPVYYPAVLEGTIERDLFVASDGLYELDPVSQIVREIEHREATLNQIAGRYGVRNRDNCSILYITKD